jgi:hypothetical protein
MPKGKKAGFESQSRWGEPQRLKDAKALKVLGGTRLLLRENDSPDQEILRREKATTGGHPYQLYSSLFAIL